MKVSRWIVLVFVFVWISDRIIASIERRLLSRSKNFFVQMFEGHKRADILIFGDSRADRNFDLEMLSRETGLSVSNFGLGGNSVIVSETLLKDYLAVSGSPKLILVEVSHSTVNPRSLGEMQMFSCYSSNLLALERAFDPPFSYSVEVFHSLRFNNQTFWRALAEAYVAVGDRMLGNRIPDSMAYPTNPPIVHRPIFDENLAALKRMAEIAHDRKIPVFFILAPNWPGFIRRIDNFDKWKRAMEEKLSGEVLYDFSLSLPPEVDLFNDEMHLNRVGARKFTAEVISQVLNASFTK